MKKIVSLLAILSVIYSCDKIVDEPGDEQEPITSLVGTTWVCHVEQPQNNWVDFEVAFKSATHCTLSSKGSDSDQWSVVGTYDYDSPTLVIEEDRYTHTGIVENGVLKLRFWLMDDICYMLDLKQQ